MMSKSQTLITGVYRTGSEYLTQLLGCHPELHASMYRVNVLRFMYRRYDPIGFSENQQRALEDLNERLRMRYEMQVDVGKILEKVRNIPGLSYGSLYDLIMSELYLKDGLKHWAEKVQLMWREIPIFLGMMPNGRALHIIRDPRAVLASFKRYTAHAYPACLGAVFNCFDAMMSALQHQRAFGDHVRSVRYEELVVDPEKVTNKIWEFLGLSPGHSLDKEGWKDAFGKEWHSNSSFHENTPEDAFDAQRTLDGWRDVLTQEEIGLTEHVCGNLMQHFDYEPSGVSFDLQKLESFVQGDQCISGYYDGWKRLGLGIEEFPADPLDKTTWERGLDD